MNNYFVQYTIRYVKAEYLDTYVSILERELRKSVLVDVKYVFVQEGKVYVNTYISAEDKHRAGKVHLDTITGAAVESMNYELGEDEKRIEVVVEKVELL